MARKQRQIRSSHRKGRGFLRGLALGLAVAAVVQLHHAGLPDWLDGPADDSAEGPRRVEPPKTNFDFYRFLPETEVTVDESDVPGNVREPGGRTAAPSSATAGRKPGSQSAAPPPAPRKYRVQVGSFRERKEADRLRASLALGGFESSIRTMNAADGTWHRVLLGPFRGREAAEAARARVLTDRNIDARIVPGES